jgi:hypothetical protein
MARRSSEPEQSRMEPHTKEQVRSSSEQSSSGPERYTKERHSSEPVQSRTEQHKRE